MVAPEIKFRPYVEFTAGYQTGLSGVAVTDAEGTLPNLTSTTFSLTWGISGSHNWKHTKLGLDYRGSLSGYLQQSDFDSISQSFLLGVTQQLSRHMSLSVRESAGVFTRAFGLGGLSQTVPFDPSQSYIPTTDFFDNRTYYLSSQVDLKIQKTARLSFDIGGDSFLTRYRADGLVGTTGLTARGNLQYRLSRRSTIGAAYTFEHFGYGGQYGDSVVHSFNGTFARALAAKTEISGSFGVSRIEQKSVVNVPIDPVIAILLGISSTTEIAHFVSWIPSGAVRLSRSFHQGVAYIGVTKGVTPGNGLFTTSEETSGTAGYTYTGLRRWSFGAIGQYSRSHSVGNVVGDYNSFGGGFSASRKIARSVHMVLGYNVNSYSSGDFKNYNRLTQEVHFGVGFAPGDVPLRVW